MFLSKTDIIASDLKALIGKVWKELLEVNLPAQLLTKSFLAYASTYTKNMFCEKKSEQEGSLYKSTPEGL